MTAVWTATWETYYVERLLFPPSGITCVFWFSILTLSLASLSTGNSPEKMICSSLSCELLLTLASASDALGRGEVLNHTGLFSQQRNIWLQISQAVCHIPSSPAQPHRCPYPFVIPKKAHTLSFKHLVIFMSLLIVLLLKKKKRMSESKKAEPSGAKQRQCSAERLDWSDYQVLLNSVICTQIHPVFKSSSLQLSVQGVG